MEGNMTFGSAGKPIKCKAAVSRKAGEPLIIEEIEVDPPKAWEVRIKVICTSLCHTDVSIWKTDAGPFSAFPRILGHEAIGLVESVGENVDEVKEGDMVLPVFRPNCRECKDCKSSKHNGCSVFGRTASIFPNNMPRDDTSRFRGSDGQAIHHFFSVSSFCEYTVVDVANIVKIDDSCPPDRACLLGCGVSTGIGATWKVACVDEGSTVAIFGLGSVGLAVAEGARLCGASKIIGVDLNPDKHEIGKKFGVTDFINPSNCGDKPVVEIIQEMTGGGADYCFECIGIASVMADAFSSSRQGCGKTVILGGDPSQTPLSLNSIELVMGKTVTGCFFGGLKPKSDVPKLVKQYMDKELNLDDFITHHLSFQEINKAFDLLIEGKSLRCIMWMDK